MHPAPTVVYEQLAEALSAAGLHPNAAEVHGIICGSICNQMKTGQGPDLQRLLTAGADVSAESLGPLRQELEELLQQTVETLYGDQSDFNLLLPDDDEALLLRLQALADWCRGFLVGLLNDESFSIDQLSEDAAELARDFIAISEVDTSLNAEDDEWDLAEVEEYVRTGVQIIFEDIYSELRNNNVSRELH